MSPLVTIPVPATQFVAVYLLLGSLEKWDSKVPYQVTGYSQCLVY